MSDLTDLLGMTCSIVEAGQVKFMVRPFTLGQFEAVKEIIAEVLTASRVEKKITDPTTQHTLTFSDTDLMEGFMKSKGLIERFLRMCVEIQIPEGPQSVSFSDIPLGVSIKILKEVFVMNEDFFQESLGLVSRITAQIQEAVSEVKKLTTQPEAQVQGTEADQIEPLLDLTQAGNPVGHRSPLLYSEPASVSKN